MSVQKKEGEARPRLRYSLVAYIDFLGTKENMSKNELYLNDVLELYENAIRQIREESENTELPKISYKSFSDNIIFSLDLIKDPSSEEDKKKDRIAFETLFGFVATFQRTALKKGYLVRGGIACGDFYLNRDLVWGNALSEVVNLEEKIAIYPRIVVSENLLNLKIETNYFTKFAAVDEDDTTYINFLNGESQSQEYVQVYDSCSIKQRNAKDQKVKQKYGWVMTYMKNLHLVDL